MEGKTFLEQNISLKVQPFSREWIVSFKDPRQLWTENWFALVLEVVCAVILFQVFRNAKKNGPHSAYLILTAMIAATCFEILPLLPQPGYQLWWYHLGLVNVLKQRVPSYVIVIFCLVHYLAHCLTSRSNLPIWTRSLTTSISATLIMFPCLWLAPRLLLLFLHFDDPVFRNRLVNVPYIELLILMLLFFHSSHLFHQNFMSIEPQERNSFSYLKCAIQSGLVSAIYTYIEQYLLYILFTLTMRANTALCIIGALCVLIYLAKEEIKEKQMMSYSIQGIISPLFRKELWLVIAIFVFTSSLPLWLNVQNLKSSSEKLELGSCQIIHEVANTSPLEVPRRRYVCPDDTNQLHFDFHCISKKELTLGVKNNTKNYTACGKSFEDTYQISKQLAMYSLFCITLFYSMMRFTFTFKVQENIIVDICKKIE